MKEEDYLQYIEDIKNMNEDELRQQLIAFYKSSLLSCEIKQRLRQEIELRDYRIKELEEENNYIKSLIEGRGR